MTAEETFLNDHLEKEGFEVVETDLGEWIIQLRHEGPSHMVMPAIHLSRQEVADLFTKVTGENQEPDIGKLVKVARKELRKHFLIGRHGHQRGQLRHRRNRHPGHHQQRRQRPPDHHPAPGPRGPGGGGQADARPGRGLAGS